jgi:hypothetical protein
MTAKETEGRREDRGLLRKQRVTQKIEIQKIQKAVAVERTEGFKGDRGA